MEKKRELALDVENEFGTAVEIEVETEVVVAEIGIVAEVSAVGLRPLAVLVALRRVVAQMLHLQQSDLQT